LIFYQKYICQAKYPARYPAGYPVSGFWFSRISGRPDIRQNQYPVHPYTVGQPTLSKIFMIDPKQSFFMREYASAAHGTAVSLTHT
jgi:hypothetical protein